MWIGGDIEEYGDCGMINGQMKDMNGLIWQFIVRIMVFSDNSISCSQFGSVGLCDGDIIRSFGKMKKNFRGLHIF